MQLTTHCCQSLLIDFVTMVIHIRSNKRDLLLQSYCCQELEEDVNVCIQCGGENAKNSDLKASVKAAFLRAHKRHQRWYRGGNLY